MEWTGRWLVLFVTGLQNCFSISWWPMRGNVVRNAAIPCVAMESEIKNIEHQENGEQIIINWILLMMTRWDLVEMCHYRKEAGKVHGILTTKGANSIWKNNRQQLYLSCHSKESSCLARIAALNINDHACLRYMRNRYRKGCSANLSEKMIVGENLLLMRRSKWNKPASILMHFHTSSSFLHVLLSFIKRTLWRGNISPVFLYGFPKKYKL